jgi:hypothetical protein
MGSFFAAETLTKLAETRADIKSRFDKLQSLLLSRKFKSVRAEEYARQGLGRRLDEMNRAIDFIFDIVPPEQEEPPEVDNRVVTTMLLQSYFMNVQGCLDNIAWIWVYETDQRSRDGSEFSRGSVGLAQRYLLKSFSSSFRTHIRSLKKWFKHVAEFRDSAAHRIPLYIPPYFVQTSDAPEYERLGHEAVAAFQRGDMAAYDDYRAKQNALGKFQPIISHSPVEDSPACVFHIQVLQDFLTVDEIAHKLFDEIDDFKPVPRGRFSWVARLRPWR